MNYPKRTSNYYAFSRVISCLMSIENGELISEFEVKSLINETEDIQKSEGEFVDLVFEKTVQN
jgi:hypothetical protein